VISIHVRCTRGAVHDRVQVFIGPDEDHRASVGWLTTRREETAALWRLWGSTIPPGNPPSDIYEEVP
jgi:hypothetical protein